ncbi:hypothetical protein ONE63_011550 [Megalurothrips usitatus]|uniref:Uncharacterized protein n=1 Tax=Megalurothrips usitatus TaxID=439358 RepID=A0AAV7X2S6_9NEOP|nr:hypothetical protein ONE63_011550 [Megalurothrips usitatus]
MKFIIRNLSKRVSWHCPHRPCVPLLGLFEATTNLRVCNVHAYVETNTEANLLCCNCGWLVSDYSTRARINSTLQGALRKV